MTELQILSIVIFLVTMFAIMTERVHRSVAALSGAVLLVIFRVLTAKQGIEAVDFNTIGVLMGMMLFVAVVKQSGIFEYIAIKSAKLSRGRPWIIMVVFMFITAVLSAFLDNVTTVLLVGPMTIAVTGILELNPIPFLMTQIMSSNIGGTATLIGDPPNIMIGSAANFSFIDFITNTGATVLVVLCLFVILFYFIYGRHLKVSTDKMEKIMRLDEKKAIKSRSLMVKSIIIMIAVVLAFMFHDTIQMESSMIALTAAVIMLLIGKQDPEDIILSVEWSTILFFIGLFVVVGGLKDTGVIQMLANGLLGITKGHQIITMVVILWISAVVSGFLDNIPFVATMIPLILTMQSSGMVVEPLWWALSLGACLGGNGTLVGASANVVLSDISKKNGYPITFAYYLKRGFPLMIVSISIATVFLIIKFN
ncbi:ArsB/NhaD family transporter [Clostridium sp. E02]|uniref:SLC13 family permease n=1 Tax=Clostridium sp. E02 TaxID=2487134 RepID=UPI000F53A0F7|nr:ArsB/NhaD family transporter [Clostridium sp. E02]